MTDNKQKKGGRGSPSPWPKSSLHLIAKEISAKEIKLEAKIINSKTERTIRFVLNGVVPVPEGVVATLNFCVEKIFKVPVNTTELKVRVEAIGEPRLSDEITVVIPTTPSAVKRSGRKVAKLIRLATANDGTTFSVTLVRVAESGNRSKGNICFTHPETAQVSQKPTDENGVVNFSFLLREEQKRVNFFVPENPSVSLEQIIPAQKKPSVPPPPTEDFLTKLKKSTEKGRRSWRERYNQ